MFACLIRSLHTTHSASFLEHNLYHRHATHQGYCHLPGANENSDEIHWGFGPRMQSVRRHARNAANFTFNHRYFSQNPPQITYLLAET